MGFKSGERINQISKNILFYETYSRFAIYYLESLLITRSVELTCNTELHFLWIQIDGERERRGAWHFVEFEYYILLKRN